MEKILIGTWAEIPTPYVTHIMSKAGLDFSIIDMEHGIIGFEQAQNMIFAASSEGKKTLIRVPSIEEVWVTRALDTGCDGIIFPQVSNIEDVEKIVSLSYFSPIGSRGFNPYITAGGYVGGKKEYFKVENDRIWVGIILEGKEAFENLESILRFEEVDIVYIGQYDLSIALGVPGRVNASIVLETMEQTVKKIRKYGKRAGCMVHDIEEGRVRIKQGFDFIVYKVDSGILYQSINNFVEGVKEYEAI